MLQENTPVSRNPTKDVHGEISDFASRGQLFLRF